MYKFNIFIFCSLILGLTACKKQSQLSALPDGSISIQYTEAKDTLQKSIQALKDSAVVLGLKAQLSGNTSGSDHYVKFAVDTTKIVAYRAKYGAATLLPAACYYFYHPNARIAAGTSVSDSAQLNIVHQTKLEGYTTYILPVTIQAVDGQINSTATTRVVYYVLKTGKPSFINKVGWTIASVSSDNGPGSTTATLLDDNNLTTYWTSSLTQQMPQWVVINFNKTLIFTAVNYYVPTAIAYPKSGAYPTSIQIETSMDGVTWVNNGVFAGNIANNAQTLTTGLVTAKYLRWTCLASVKYAGVYSVIFISGISLVP